MDTSTDAVTTPAYSLSERDLRTLARASAILARVEHAAGMLAFKSPGRTTRDTDTPDAFDLGLISAAAGTARDSLANLAITLDVHAGGVDTLERMRDLEEAATPGGVAGSPPPRPRSASRPSASCGS
jgi:hypothetical protein